MAMEPKAPTTMATTKVIKMIITMTSTMIKAGLRLVTTVMAMDLVSAVESTPMTTLKHSVTSP